MDNKPLHGKDKITTIRRMILAIMSLLASVCRHTRMLNFKMYPSFRLDLIIICVKNQMVDHLPKSVPAKMTRL